MEEATGEGGHATAPPPAAVGVTYYNHNSVTIGWTDPEEGLDGIAASSVEYRKDGTNGGGGGEDGRAACRRGRGRDFLE